MSKGNLSVGDRAVRREYLVLNPYDLILLEERRGRHFTPTPEQIVSMAVSIWDNEQQQPCVARRGQDGRLYQVSGFTRNNAVRLIREGFVTMVDGEEVKIHNPDYGLKVIIRQCSEQEALILNIVENAHRNNTSPIDDAYNQKELRDEGRTDVEIARIYGYSSSVKVGQLKKLLNLPQNIQEKVHSGELSTSAAINLLNLSNDEQASVLNNADRTGTGRINGASVSALIRNQLLNDNGSDISAKPVVGRARGSKSPSMSMKELKEFLTTAQEEESSVVRHFASCLQDLLNGKIDINTCLEKMDSYDELENAA